MIDAMPATPTDPEAESAVLGACLLAVQCIAVGIELGVSEASFFTPNHQAIWLALTQWYATPPTHEQSVNALILWEQVRRNGHEKRVDGVYEIATLQSRATNTDMHCIRQHCQNLLEWQQRRDIYITAHHLTRSAPDVTVPMANLHDTIDATLGRLSRDEGPGLCGMDVAVAAAWDYIRSNAGKCGPLGVPTGFADADRLLDGLEAGQVMIVAARPSEGKSALVWQIAEHAAETVGPVAYFSLEMSALALTMRALQRRTQLDSWRLRRGQIPPERKHAFDAALCGLSELPIYLDTRGGLAVAQIRARCQLIQKKVPLALVVIDYLQLIAAPRANSREQEVSKISRELKGVAMTLGVPMILVSQMSRSSEYRGDRRPVLTDLRDSGQIEQDADVVGFLYHPYRHQPNAPEGQVEWIFRKNREGSTGTVLLGWEPQHAAFTSASLRVVDQAVG